MDVLRVLGTVGAIYGVLIVAAAMLLSLPVPAEPSRRCSGSFQYRDRFFSGLLAGMFAGTFAGLALIGNLKPMALYSGLGEGVATAAIAIFAVGNAAGRVAWGWLADHLGRRAGWLSLAFLALATAGLAAGRSQPIVFLGASALVGFGFGACFVVYAALVANHYGVERLGEVYPLVFLAYGLSGIAGPATAGWLLDATGGYGAALILCLAIPAAAALLLHHLFEEAAPDKQTKAL
jgi:OFA family oxalate/formate antiporter-like MFS transporter